MNRLSDTRVAVHGGSIHRDVRGPMNLPGRKVERVRGVYGLKQTILKILIHQLQIYWTK